MLKRLVLLLGVLLTGIVSFCCQSASVWQISKDGQSIYIGGTLHILSPADFPLPEAYATAYNNADKLVFETDIGGLNTAQFQRDMMQRLTYQNGTRLKDTLSESTYRLLSAHLAQRNLDIAEMAHYTPALMSITLSVTELRQMGFTSQGVDEFYYFRAMMDRKQIDWFESPQQQLEFIAELGGQDEDQMIRYALEDVKQLPDTITELKTLWRSGDMQQLYRNQASQFRDNFPAIYQSLLIDRNQRWLPMIEAMMTDDTTEFVLVGTMHLSGADSVLDLLQNKGYQVLQL
ncbi:TraB/GumN family protein [Alteromonas gilva]|uniref:TraB/GumN family protein n=1 Tax=Alteromonas gilva TaxID=2987522 RepID=A0ABT5L0N1_9ALTE|nr:TraB/GumN family protein [Alteromonas gilva]MDC8830577.1 TraB/GumN family protein [Alteromonas gilva]